MQHYCMNNAISDGLILIPNFPFGGTIPACGDCWICVACVRQIALVAVDLTVLDTSFILQKFIFKNFFGSGTNTGSSKIGSLFPVPFLKTIHSFQLNIEMYKQCFQNTVQLFCFNKLKHYSFITKFLYYFNFEPMQLSIILSHFYTKFENVRPEK